jgi:hypothetical protein
VHAIHQVEGRGGVGGAHRLVYRGCQHHPPHMSLLVVANTDLPDRHGQQPAAACAEDDARHGGTWASCGRQWGREPERDAAEMLGNWSWPHSRLMFACVGASQLSGSLWQDCGSEWRQE